jgi:hypothetical protein
MLNFCCGSKKKPKTSQVQPNKSFIDAAYPNGQENYMLNVQLINKNKKQIKRMDRSTEEIASANSKEERKDEEFQHSYTEAVKLNKRAIADDNAR